MRRAAKRDATEAELVDALRHLGASVRHLNARGLPDLLIGLAGLAFLGEVKTRRGRATVEQVAFAETWRGPPVWVLRTMDDVVALVRYAHELGARRRPATSGSTLRLARTTGGTRMVKFTASGAGRTLVGLGFEEENIERMRRGQPVRVRFKDLGFVGALGTVELMLFTGKDAASLQRDLAPFIGPETVVHSDDDDRRT
jgi:hypothetical protein